MGFYSRPPSGFAQGRLIWHYSKLVSRGFDMGIVGSRRAIEPPTFQQRLDVRIAANEILKQPEGVGRSAAREQRCAKAIAVLAL